MALKQASTLLFVFLSSLCPTCVSVTVYGRPKPDRRHSSASSLCETLLPWIQEGRRARKFPRSNHLPKRVGGDDLPSSVHNRYTACCPLPPFTGLPILIVEDGAASMEKTSWELSLCVKHGQDRGVSLMVCGVCPVDWTKGTGWPGCNVKRKALRSCRSCSEKRKTGLETGTCRHWNHSRGGSEIYPLGESQKMRLLNQEMAKASSDYLFLRASVWQVSMNRKQQQELFMAGN